MKSRQVKSCGAITKKGSPCRRIGLDRYNGLCAQHGTKKSSRNGLLKKVERAVGLGANLIAVASGVSTTVTYVSGHWDAIMRALSSLGTCFVTDYEFTSNQRIKESDFRENKKQNWIFTLAEEAKYLTEKSTEIMIRQYSSEEEAIELSRRFSSWFKALPLDVQEKAELHVGKKRIDELLLYP